jgi:hypothetical protein
VRNSLRGIVFAALLLSCFAIGAGSAQAGTLVAPSDGAHFAGGDTTTFKWHWPDANQPWESRIVWGHAADPADKDWYDASKIIQSGRIDGQSASVQFDSTFTKGQWYWRVCNYLIESSDDFCHYADTEVRGFVMTSTAIPDLTKASAGKLIVKAIKRKWKGASGVHANSCRFVQKNYVSCVGKWVFHGATYTSLSATASRNLKTRKTSVRIADVRSY